MKPFTPIGYVRNSILKPEDGFRLKQEKSEIEILPEFLEGFKNIHEQSCIDVVFYFHQSEGYKLITPIYTGEIKGVFSSRSPHRPNGIGITAVKLHAFENGRLVVSGLDAMNGTPVLDVKPCDNSFFEENNQSRMLTYERLKNNPRAEIIRLIKSNNQEQLMMGAAQMHGHYCPGLAMGIMAATHAVNQLGMHSDGMEDVLAITETNNCFSDGVQFVTGCSFGNNALIFRDIGKTAFTLARRDGNGIRVSSTAQSREVINSAFPDFNRLYQQVVAQQNHDEQLKTQYKKAAMERAFGTLSLPFNELFKTAFIKVEIPPYAAIVESAICARCGESVMKSKTIVINNLEYCADCVGK